MREYIFLATLFALVGIASMMLAEPPINTLDTKPVVIERYQP